MPAGFDGLLSGIRQFMLSRRCVAAASVGQNGGGTAARRGNVTRGRRDRGSSRALRVGAAGLNAVAEARDAVRVDIVPSPDSIAIRTIRPSERRNVGARYVLRVPRRMQVRQ